MTRPKVLRVVNSRTMVHAATSKVVAHFDFSCQFGIVMLAAESLEFLLSCLMPTKPHEVHSLTSPSCDFSRRQVKEAAKSAATPRLMLHRKTSPRIVAIELLRRYGLSGSVAVICQVGCICWQGVAMRSRQFEVGRSSPAHMFAAAKWVKLVCPTAFWETLATLID